MSTKCSIAHGTGFHLYNEVFDEKHVFLQLENANFEVTPDRVMVKLPLHVWEYIRSFPGADLSYADVSDEQIHQAAVHAVDSRLAKAAEAAEANSDRMRNLVEVGSSFVMGDIALPREEQIANYVAHHQRLRAQQREVLAQVESLRNQQQ